jgi:hypothetical protein
MKICCTTCHQRIKLKEIIVMDKKLKNFYHRGCFPIHYAESIKDIGTLKEIKEKYSKQPIH